jgi:hypothetical protein
MSRALGRDRQFAEFRTDDRAGPRARDGFSEALSSSNASFIRQAWRE